MTTFVAIVLVVSIASFYTGLIFGEQTETGHLKRQIGELITEKEALWRQIRRKPR